MILLLPVDADARAASYTRLSEPTKKQLIETIRVKSPDEQSETLQGILRQGGGVSEFFRYILGKETDPVIRHNKKITPVQFK